MRNKPPTDRRFSDAAPAPEARAALHFVADMLAQMSAMAKNVGEPMLGHFLDLGREEALDRLRRAARQKTSDTLPPA